MRPIVPACAVMVLVLSAAAGSAQVPAASPPSIAGAPPAAAAPSTAMPDWTFEQFVQSSGPLAKRTNMTPLAIGAVSGVVLFNMVGAMLAPAAAAGAPLAGTILADSALAASRIYAVGSAVLGAWAADWIYANVYETVGTR